MQDPNFVFHAKSRPNRSWQCGLYIHSIMVQAFKISPFNQGMFRCVKFLQQPTHSSCQTSAQGKSTNNLLLTFHFPSRTCHWNKEDEARVNRKGLILVLCMRRKGRALWEVSSIYFAARGLLLARNLCLAWQRGALFCPSILNRGIMTGFWLLPLCFRWHGIFLFDTKDLDLWTKTSQE